MLRFKVEHAPCQELVAVADQGDRDFGAGLTWS